MLFSLHFFYKLLREICWNRNYNCGFAPPFSCIRFCLFLHSRLGLLCLVELSLLNCHCEMSFIWGSVVLEPVLSDTVSLCVFSCLFAFNLSILTVRVVFNMLVVAGMSLRRLGTPQVTEVLFFLKTSFLLCSSSCINPIAVFQVHWSFFCSMFFFLN